MRRLRLPRELARLARGLRPDGNPLRRATDRAETKLVIGLIAAFSVGAPVAAIAAMHWASASGLRAEQMVRYKVHARLLLDAPKLVFTTYGPVGLPAPARWTAPDGSSRIGLVNTDSRGSAGTMVTIWTNRTGRPIGPRPSVGQLTMRTALAAAAGPIILGLAMLVVGTLAHAAINRRRLAAWAAAWRVVGPQWTGRK